MPDEETPDERRRSLARTLGALAAIMAKRARPPASGEPQLLLDLPVGDKLEVEWDENKALATLRERGVAFKEAATVFGDPLSSTVEDLDHSWDENRFVTIGLTRNGNLVVVCFTPRGHRIRLISARMANSGERKRYEQGG